MSSNWRILWILQEKGNESEHINLKVLGQDNAVVQFKIKRHTPLRKLMNAYCDRAVSTSIIYIKLCCICEFHQLTYFIYAISSNFFRAYRCKSLDSALMDLQSMKMIHPRLLRWKKAIQLKFTNSRQEEQDRIKACVR